jgi:thiamine kinase-like enzyme
MDTSPDADGDLERILDLIPLFAGRSRRISPLPGGLTNRNYRITTADGSYVLRRSPPPDADLLAIDREREYVNSRSAAEAGVGAEVVAYLPAEHVLVVRWIPGRTFTDASFAEPGAISRVAEACRRLHRGPRFAGDFDMFELQRRYLGVVHDNGFRLPARYEDFHPQVDRISRALAVRSEATVPCNNDLLAGNFIDDGERVWIIDYEYAGNNDACFELGNIWSECHLSLEQLSELLDGYYGRPLRNKLARAQLLGVMSKYGWTLWASIQQATSPLDFDFWSWGMEKYDAAEAMFRGGDFERLLGDVQRAD